MQIDDTITKANFNPRSPCGERRCDRLSNCFSAIFQSTLPVRGATGLNACGLHSRWISIHAPRAGSDPQAWHAGRNRLAISIHAPRAGSDLGAWRRTVPAVTFQSTLPVRGATFVVKIHALTAKISIHAPRAGSDPGGSGRVPVLIISIHAPRAGSDVAAGTPPCVRSTHFNPRSPCGERRKF